MPNIPQQQTIVQYLANNAQTQYTFDFYAPFPTDIQVYLQAPNVIPIPSADILILNTNYTVTYNADPTTGGYITLLVAPTTGWYLTINRQVQASLNTNFANAQNFNGANLDAALDRLLLLCQQNQNYNLERNLSYVINTYLPNATPYTQLPPLAQNYIWIGSGAGVVAAQLSLTPDASVLQSMLANNSPGTDGGRLVGYYDIVQSNPTTVTAFLNNLASYTGDYLIDSGSVNNYVVTSVSGIPAYKAGLSIKVLIGNTNTLPNCVLNVNGLGTKNIILTNGNQLLPGDLPAGMVAEFTYDGTNMQLLNPSIGLNRPAIVASIYCAATHAWTTTGAVTVEFDTVEFDPYGMFYLAMRGFKVPFTGKYRFSALLAYSVSGSSGANSSIMYLIKNAALSKRFSAFGLISEIGCFSGDCIVQATAGDIFQIFILKTDGSTATYATDGIGGTPQQCSSFCAEYLGT